jgi:hypothetical protein
MLTIWKFPLGPSLDDIRISMPKGAKVLSVQAQHDAPMVWAIVQPDADKETRRFVVFGTGHPIAHHDIDVVASRFVGTFQMSGGALVFHLFEAA